MTVGIIIQARMGSTRLPGKVLMDIGGKLLLEHVTGRLKLLKTPVTIVVATSDLEQDDVIKKWCIKNNIKCFRGSEKNVLSRYAKCADQYNFNHIIRLTADNPFTDIDELDNLVKLHLTQQNDYTHSFGELPIGVGAEIFTSEALKKSFAEGKKLNHLEHVNEYILENPNLFKIGNLVVVEEKRAPHLHLTVDVKDDLERACAIIEKHPQKKYLGTLEIIKLCSPSV